MAWRYVITDSAQSHYSFSDNAEMVYSYLSGQGFSYASIIGVLANMEHESYLNLGQMEIGKGGSTDYGYGLVQWTPAKDKILKYASDNNLNWFDGITQMQYFDINVPASWGTTSSYPETFNQFKTVTDYSRATRIFFYNFERGTWHDALDTYADYWNNYFQGQPPVPPVPPTPISKDMLILLMAGKKIKNRKFDK